MMIVDMIMILMILHMIMIMMIVDMIMIIILIVEMIMIMIMMVMIKITSSNTGTEKLLQQKDTYKYVCQKYQSFKRSSSKQNIQKRPFYLG